MVGKIVAAGLVCAGMAAGQTAAAPQASSAQAASTHVSESRPGAPAPAKAYAFDVVSIRQNISTQQNGMPQFGPTPDGYRMTNMPMMLAIMTAFVPQTDGAVFFTQSDVKGLPDWMYERYDIDARISDEDRAAWQNPEMQKAMLQAMLQAMLADRCKLAVHREVKEVAVYSLVVAKGGPKFKETDPTVEHPDGIKLPWGGVLVESKDSMSLYGSSMASLATLLSSIGGNGAGRQIQDKTGLTGWYDIVLKRPQQSAPPAAQQGGPEASDPGGSIIYSMVGDLGLKLEPTKGQVETLVIDHIERPSAN